jgi:phosphonopyruvate decarboxylase
MVIKKGLFDDYIPPDEPQNKKGISTKPELMSREQTIGIIAGNMPEDSAVVSTTGKTSRELFELREQRSQTHGTDFYTVGSMGCASSIGLGVGLAESDKQVYILDGDGAALMQLGTMATIGHYKNKRIKHILLDNNAHESTGSQPTVSDSVDFMGIARSCGYETVLFADNETDLKTCLKEIRSNEKLSFLLVKIKTGARPDLGRPTTTPRENRDAFIRHFKGQ